MPLVQPLLVTGKTIWMVLQFPEGINQGISYLLEEDLPSNYPECIFVVLNQNRITLFADPSVCAGITEPYFDGVFEQIFRIYREFNAEPGRTIESGLQASFSKKPGTNVVGSKKEKFIYNASQIEYDKCSNILKLFYEALLKAIIHHLPLKPVFRPDDKKVNSSKIFCSWITNIWLAFRLWGAVTIDRAEEPEGWEFPKRFSANPNFLLLPGAVLWVAWSSKAEIDYFNFVFRNFHFCCYIKQTINLFEWVIHKSYRLLSLLLL